VVIVLWSFLAFAAAIGVMAGFIPHRDLNSYDSLAAGGGVKIEGTLVGTAPVITSGSRRGGDVTKQCASYRYTGGDGVEKFFTDRYDCYGDPAAAPRGQTAQLLATRSLNAEFVFSAATRKELVADGRWMRWIGIGSGVVLVVSIIAVVVVIRRRPPLSEV
jgi:hypothetical protein